MSGLPLVHSRPWPPALPLLQPALQLRARQRFNSKKRAWEGQECRRPPANQPLHAPGLSIIDRYRQGRTMAILRRTMGHGVGHIPCHELDVPDEPPGHGHE